MNLSIEVLKVIICFALPRICNSLVQLPSSRLTSCQTEYSQDICAVIGHMIIIYNFKKLVRNLRDHLKFITVFLRMALACYSCFVALWTAKVMLFDTWWLSYILYNSKFVFPPVYQSLTLYMLSLSCLGGVITIDIFFMLGLGFMIGDVWTQHGCLYALYHLGKTCFICAKSLSVTAIEYIKNDDDNIIKKNQ